MSIEQRVQSPRSWLSMLMSLIVITTVDFAITGYASTPYLTVLRSVCYLIVALAIYELCVRVQHRRKSHPTHHPLILACVFLGLPITYSLIRFAAIGELVPVEQTLLSWLRNILLLTIVIPDYSRLRHVRAPLGLFLMITSVVVGVHEILESLLVLYVLCGTTWLLADYWIGLQNSTDFFSDGRSPWVMMTAIVGTVVASFLVGLGGSPTTLGIRFAGFVPSSGGSQWSNSRAIDGVGNGDAGVAGENAESTGFIEEDIFMESQDDSLYDIASEMYGEPRSQKRGFEKAIALSAQDITFLKNHGNAAKNNNAGRSFELLRKTPGHRHKGVTRDAEALMFVSGRTPLHIRLSAYDRFDGQNWLEESSPSVSSGIRLDQDNWFDILRRGHSFLRGDLAKHSIRIGTWKGSRIPWPANTSRFRLGRINKQSWFSWVQNDILQMIRTIPGGNSIELESRVVDRSTLSNWSRNTTNHAQYLQLPDDQDDSAHWRNALAAWIDDEDEGLAQVTNLVERVRAHVPLDCKQVVPDHAFDPTSFFMKEATSAPSYLFASTATLLLRQAGYPARLVSGFYAHPDKYAYTTNHTPVHKEDLHFWIEVMSPEGLWIPMDPSPGYAVLLPARSFVELAQAMTAQLGSWAAGNIPAAVLVLFCFAAIWMQRANVFNALATVLWRMQSMRSHRMMVLATMRLLEYRARLCRRPREPGVTHGQWLATLLSSQDQAVRDSAERLIRISDWAMYSPTTHILSRELYLQHTATCHEIAKSVSLGRIRTAGKGSIS